MQISELDDRPIPNILLTVRQKCPVDRRQMATAIRFSAPIAFRQSVAAFHAILY